MSTPATALAQALTVFQEYDARSGSSSVRDGIVDYQNDEQIEKRTPPTVWDITTKNYDRTSGQPHMRSLKDRAYRNQRPFAPVFDEDRPSGINERRGSQYGGCHPDLHGVLNIGLFQLVPNDPDCLFNPSPEGEG